MTEGQYKELIEFLEEKGELTVIAERAVSSNSIQIRIAKEVEKDVFHYILLTIPMTKES